MGITISVQVTTSGWARLNFRGTILKLKRSTNISVPCYKKMDLQDLLTWQDISSTHSLALPVQIWSRPEMYLSCSFVPQVLL